MDFEIGVVPVRLARQQRLELAPFALRFQCAQRGEALVLGLGVALGLAEFDERRRVVELALDLGERASRPPAGCARASASARPRGRSRDSGLRIWRSVRLDAASRHRRRRCLLSSPTDCLMVSTSVRLRRALLKVEKLVPLSIGVGPNAASSRSERRGQTFTSARRNSEVIKRPPVPEPTDRSPPPSAASE